jgi:hypothetical protein
LGSSFSKLIIFSSSSISIIFLSVSTPAELEVKKLEEQQRQNEREMQELQGYQKEIEVYTGQNGEGI